MRERTCSVPAGCPVTLSAPCGLFENATQGIFQTTTEGRYIAANPALARMYGFEDAAELMEVLTDIESQLYADPGRRAEFCRAMRDEGEVRGFESRITRRDGVAIWISESARAVRDEEGRVVYYEGFVEDISDRKRAEESLRQAHVELERRVLERTRKLRREVAERRRAEQKLQEALETAERATSAKSAFLADMSHELRTPLNAIIGFSDMMLHQVLGPLGHDRYGEYMRDIKTSAAHLLELINDVLDTAKVEAGKLELTLGPVSPMELAGKAVGMVKSRAATVGCRIIVQSRHDLPEIIGDERRLVQVLVNLLGNSVKFTPAEGSVTLGLDLEGDMLAITVADTGIGMAPEDIPKALSPFGQVASGLDLNPDGTGLGLPLAKRLVEAHGGSLKLESRPGHGTTATIRLPLANAKAEKAA